MPKKSYFFLFPLSTREGGGKGLATKVFFEALKITKKDVTTKLERGALVAVPLKKELFRLKMFFNKKQIPLD